MAVLPLVAGEQRRGSGGVPWFNKGLSLAEARRRGEEWDGFAQRRRGRRGVRASRAGDEGDRVSSKCHPAFWTPEARKSTPSSPRNRCRVTGDTSSAELAEAGACFGVVERVA